MKAKIVKVFLYVLHMLLALILSIFLPPHVAVSISFALGYISQWSWKVITNQRTLGQGHIQAMREFVSAVYVMRDAQKCYDVVPEGKYLIKKLELEGRVDEDLKVFVSEQVHAEWKKEKEVTNG